MKNKIRLLILFCVSSLSFFSCKKLSDDEQKPKLVTQKNIPLIADFFKKHGVKSQFFVIGASEESTVVGEKGTEVVFPAKCFTNSQGDTVKGSVQIELKEILSIADMVLSNAPTMSNNIPLISGGEFLILPTQAKDKLNYAKPIKISVPATSIDTNMMLFTSYGTPEDNALNWIPLRNSESFFKFNTNNSKPSTRSESKYVANVKFPPLQWWGNIDKSFPQRDFKYLTLKTDTSGYIYSTSFFIIVDTFTTTATAHHNLQIPGYAPIETIAQYYSSLLPVGEKITILGLRIKDDGLYFNKKDIYFSKADTVNFNFLKTSEEEVVKEIEKL